VNINTDIFTNLKIFKIDLKMKKNPPKISEKVRKFFTNKSRKKFDSSDIKEKGIKTHPLKINEITNLMIDIKIPVWFH